MVNLKGVPKKFHKEFIKLWKQYDAEDWSEIERQGLTNFRDYIYKYGSKEFASHTKDKYERLRAAQDKLDRKGTGGRIN